MSAFVRGFSEAGETQPLATAKCVFLSTSEVTESIRRNLLKAWFLGILTHLGAIKSTPTMKSGDLMECFSVEFHCLRVDETIDPFKCGRVRFWSGAGSCCAIGQFRVEVAWVEVHKG